MNTGRSVALRTVGCRLNRAETAQITGSFKNAGYTLRSFDDNCDVYVVHSCTITAKAERKSIQYARSIKNKHPEATVILAGCAVEADKEGRLKKTGIDLLLNQKQKYHIPSILADKQQEPKSEFQISNFKFPVFTTTRALVKVQDGCDFHCAYCIIPKARGNPTSRPFKEIIKEVTKLTETGYIEIVLTGANLGCYRYGKKTLVDLLSAIEELPRVQRIRVSSIEISTVESALIDHMAKSKKTCRYLHFPLQSGADTILSSMGRRYTTADFCNVIKYAAEKIHLLGLGTDIITGLPGESEEQHMATVDLVKSLPLNNLHVFPYSRRQGTRAADMPGQVDTGTKKIRCEKLIKIGEAKRMDFAKRFIGKPVSVLVEQVDKKGYARGWTGEYIEARIHSENISPNQIISFLPDKITKKTVLNGLILHP